MKSISTIESLTTMPERATTPNIVNSDNGMPSRACPNTAPAAPNGMAVRISNGCRYERNSIVSSTNIANTDTMKPSPRLRSESFVCSCSPSHRMRTAGWSASSFGISRCCRSATIWPDVSDDVASMSAVIVIDRFWPSRLISE